MGTTHYSIKLVLLLLAFSISITFVSAQNTIILPEEEVILDSWVSPYEYDYRYNYIDHWAPGCSSNYHFIETIGANKIKGIAEHELDTYIYYRTLIYPNGKEEIIDIYTFDNKNATDVEDYVGDCSWGCPDYQYYSDHVIPEKEIEITPEEGDYVIEVRRIQVPVLTVKNYPNLTYNSILDIYDSVLLNYHTKEWGNWYHQVNGDSSGSYKWDAHNYLCTPTKIEEYQMTSNFSTVESDVQCSDNSMMLVNGLVCNHDYEVYNYKYREDDDLNSWHDQWDYKTERYCWIDKKINSSIKLSDMSEVVANYSYQLLHPPEIIGEFEDMNATEGDTVWFAPKNELTGVLSLDTQINGLTGFDVISVIEDFEGLPVLYGDGAIWKKEGFIFKLEGDIISIMCNKSEDECAALLEPINYSNDYTFNNTKLYEILKTEIYGLIKEGYAIGNISFSGAVLTTDAFNIFRLHYKENFIRNIEHTVINNGYGSTVIDKYLRGEFLLFEYSDPKFAFINGTKSCDLISLSYSKVIYDEKYNMSFDNPISNLYVYSSTDDKNAEFDYVVFADSMDIKARSDYKYWKMYYSPWGEYGPWEWYGSSSVYPVCDYNQTVPCKPECYYVWDGGLKQRCVHTSTTGNQIDFNKEKPVWFYDPVYDRDGEFVELKYYFNNTELTNPWQTGCDDAGTYTITVVAEDPYGLKDTANFVLTIEGNESCIVVPIDHPATNDSYTDDNGTNFRRIGFYPQAGVKNNEGSSKINIKTLSVLGLISSVGIASLGASVILSKKYSSQSKLKNSVTSLEKSIARTDKLFYTSSKNMDLRASTFIGKILDTQSEDITLANSTNTGKFVYTNSKDMNSNASTDIDKLIYTNSKNKVLSNSTTILSDPQPVISELPEKCLEDLERVPQAYGNWINSRHLSPEMMKKLNVHYRFTTDSGVLDLGDFEEKPWWIPSFLYGVPKGSDTQYRGDIEGEPWQIRQYGEVYAAEKEVADPRFWKKEVSLRDALKHSNEDFKPYAKEELLKKGVMIATALDGLGHFDLEKGFVFSSPISQQMATMALKNALMSVVGAPLWDSGERYEEVKDNYMAYCLGDEDAYDATIQYTIDESLIEALIGIDDGTFGWVDAFVMVSNINWLRATKPVLIAKVISRIPGIKIISHIPGIKIISHIPGIKIISRIPGIRKLLNPKTTFRLRNGYRTLKGTWNYSKSKSKAVKPKREYKNEAKLSPGILTATVYGIPLGTPPVKESFTSYIVPAVSDVINTIGGGAKKVYTNIRTTTKTITNKLTQVAQGGVSKARGFINSAKTRANNLWNSTKSTVNNLWNKTKTTARTILNKAKTTAKRVVNTVRNAGKSFAKAVRKFNPFTKKSSSKSSSK